MGEIGIASAVVYMLSSVMHSFTILGAPRTKKNHGRVIQRGRRKVHVQSEAHENWHTHGMWQCAEIRGGTAGFPLMCPVSVAALFYRDRSAGDLVGYQQALADLLEDGGIIQNDRLIQSWDGTRLLKDAANPRIEVTIGELPRA